MTRISAYRPPLPRIINTGAKQGLNYGTRIRLPHALVMTLLFRKGPLKDKLHAIVKMAFLHARNLALFVATYKASLVALACAADGRCAPSSEPGRPTRPWHPLVAGALGGYLVWGDYSSVNYQISLYVFSRVVVSALRLAAQRGVEPFRQFKFEKVYPWGTAAVWATVMYLWEHHPTLLQPKKQLSRLIVGTPLLANSRSSSLRAL